MVAFGLVPGAWHGAWCWSRLTPLLEARGHRVVAVDLPCDVVGAGSAQYAQVVADALAGVDDDVVLVGHSVGGVTIPLVAARRPVRRLVYLCGALRDPGTSLIEQITNGPDADMASTPAMTGVEYGDDGLSWWSDEAAATWFLYQDCDPDTASWALRRLRRQWYFWDEVAPIDEWPDAEPVSILCTEDRVMNPEWSRRATREKLGVDALELPGGHSPFLSRPAELAELLCRGL